MNIRAAWLVALAVPLALALGLAVGSVELGARDWLAAIAGGGSDTAREIVWGLRAPRVLAGFVAGASLALAGALLQALLRNPLADPYVVGVSGGAAVGALAALGLGLTAAAASLAAAAGAAVVTLLLALFAVRRTGWDPFRVLLAGVGLAAACGAAVGVLLALAPAEQVHGMLFWLMGDLGAAPDARLAWIVLGVALAASIVIANDLDLVALGTRKAATLGVAVVRVQWIAFAAAIVATADAVLVAGAIGFIGLAVPHALRLAGVHRHRALVPLAAAGGGALLVAADAFARVVAAPVELPVGAITAAIGVPVLFWLLARTR